MATTVSASQQNSPALNSANGLDGRDSWGYTISGDAEVTNDHFSPADAPSKPYTATRQPLTQQRNGTSKRTNTMESSRSEHSTGSGGSRVVSRKKSNIGSMPIDDDFGDLYRTPTSTAPRNFPGAGNEKENKRKLPVYDAEEDESKWIHRDKLAQIESRELEEAGYKVPARNISRAASSRSSSRHKKDKLVDTQQEDFNGEELNGVYPINSQDRRQRITSPMPVEEELDDGDWDAGSPDDLNADRRQLSSGKSASSRIPIKRGHAGSGSTANDVDANPTKGRKPGTGWAGSQTDGSASVGDDAEEHSPPGTEPTSPASPRKARTPSKSKPVSGNRKASGPGKRPGGQQAQRSTSSPEKRPGTSSGRPSTSQGPPEGDPPWLSAFKPDPRLPPDQQMLPTHAKRLAQEQWEKEGKTGSAYDKEFNLLNTQDFVKPERKSSLSYRRAASKERLNENKDDTAEMPQWPLAANANANNGPASTLKPGHNPQLSTATSTGRPGTSGTDHGGYSIMPNVSTVKPQLPPQSPISPMAPPVAPRPSDVLRVPEPKEEPEEGEKAKKGCACCVVM